MAFVRLTASWIVRLWLGLLAWVGATAVQPVRDTLPPPLPGVALGTPSLALVCYTARSTALVRCPLEAMALVRYEAPRVWGQLRQRPVHLTPFGLRPRHVANRLMRA
jgi:hypothetical protein